MTRWRELWRRTASLVWRARVERGLSEEVEFHLQQQIEKNLRAGMTPGDARRHALARFGGVEQVKEAAREEFRTAIVEDFGRDLQWAARAALSGLEPGRPPVPDQRRLPGTRGPLRRRHLDVRPC
jgi:hypothetical protein